MVIWVILVGTEIIIVIQLARPTKASGVNYDRWWPIYV